MDAKQFIEIGDRVFGAGTRWGSKMATAIGVTPAMVSNIRNGRAPISESLTNRVAALVESRAADTEGAISFAGTDIAGDACFKLRLTATDLSSNKFVKVADVNPALFFPRFAPEPQVMIQQFVQSGKTVAMVTSDDHLSDEEILDRIGKRVRVMDAITSSVIAGDVPSMVVYGAPGVGKSFTIMKALNDAAKAEVDFKFDVIKGSVTAAGLYRALFNQRNGGIVMLDDSDSIFKDEESLNLLKAALDSSDIRQLSWRKQSRWLEELAEENGLRLEDVQDFEFNGGVIFITNINLKEKSLDDSRMSPHYSALISRSFYVDLTTDSTRARTLRVRQVFVDGTMATNLGLDADQAEEIMEFISNNKDELLEVSLRMANSIAKLYLADAGTWKEIVEVTKMK